ncbi:hypothetical protein TIFTF001_038804 [Ficus carica]|uniref:Uncharacterized protein n=1 Tax=Ficus carica TaxID=3494 RepID=A0AA88E7X7_FICCA|nr:hypothetical protein TIFTF001_038804 [Ficus carica]
MTGEGTTTEKKVGGEGAQNAEHCYGAGRGGGWGRREKGREGGNKGGGLRGGERGREGDGLRLRR